MVTPKEKSAPTGPTQFRPQGDSRGTWLPPKVQVPGAREPPIPMTARADARQRHRSGANQLLADTLVQWPGLPRNATTRPVARSAPRALDRNPVGSHVTRRVCEHASGLHSFAFPDRQRWGYEHRRRVIKGLGHRLLRDATMGRYRTRCASSLGFLSLPKRPFNVVMLKAFLKFRGAVAEELRKGNANRFRFIAKPSRLYQSRQFLSNLFRQINIYGFHSNSIPYCTPRGCSFSPLIL